MLHGTMLPHPYTLELLIEERRKDLLREVEQDRLARLATQGRQADGWQVAARALVASALRRLADQLEPTPALPCEQQRGVV